MTDISATDDKRMRLRYAGSCRLCGTDLPQGSTAIYERALKTVRCVSCAVVPSAAIPELPEAAVAPVAPAAPVAPVEREVEGPVDPGVPGASARQEFDRRRARREERIRGKHPRVGGLILALSDDPQSTRSWDTGAVGEERLGLRLNELSGGTLRVLHDRRVPRSTANIDHIAVTRTGVHVIDAKKYRGRPTLVVEGGVLRPRVEKVVVDGRNCTKLVDAMLKQMEVVRRALGADVDHVEVHGVLCFVEADWPLIGGSFVTRGVDVLWPRKLYPKLAADGPLSHDTVDRVHRTLAGALTPAARRP